MIIKKFCVNKDFCSIVQMHLAKLNLLFAREINHSQKYFAALSKQKENHPGRYMKHKAVRKKYVGNQ